MSEQSIGEAVAAVPLFNSDGALTCRLNGVDVLEFSKKTVFYTLITQSWRMLFAGTVGVYLAVVAIFAAVYYVMSFLCSANPSIVTSVYFVVVSISANGGYLGEDPHVLPGSSCFTYRTYVVLACSYMNIVMGAILAALLVAKATTNVNLAHRIVFSHFAVITEEHTEGNKSREMLEFRIACVAHHALIHGRLRLYVITNHQHLGKVSRPLGQTTVRLMDEELREAPHRDDVFVRTYELSWSCKEECLRNAGDLNLWYPCTIVHPIDSHSPLHGLVKTSNALGADWTHAFQVIAVFEGTDPYTGGLIEAKRVFPPQQILRHYGFTAKTLMSIDPARNDVIVNFKGFNEVSPSTNSPVPSSH